MIATEALTNEKKFFSMRELKERGLSQYKVTRLVTEGKLTKLTKSVYENMGYVGDESDFYYVMAYIPAGVICLLSAAVYYGLTTYIPNAVDVAIPRKCKVSTIPDWPQLNVYYYNDIRYKAGSQLIHEGGNCFRVYDVEKTVADIVSYREKIGIEETKEILTSYLQRQDRKLNQLLKYAKMVKCDNALRRYLEVLI